MTFGTASRGTFGETKSDQIKFLGSEYFHAAHNKLSANGTLAHLLATGGASHQVSAVEQHAVDRRRHAHLAQVLVAQFIHICKNINKKMCEFYLIDMYELEIKNAFI